MVRELLKASLLLVVIPIFTAIAMILTAHRDYALAVIYPIVLISIILLTSTKPNVSINLMVDKQVMYVGDELEVRLRLRMDRGFGIIMIRGPPIPDTAASNAFELTQGKNVYVAFKGIKTLDREFNYKLRALRRGKYIIENIDYTYYHAFGMISPIRDTIKISYSIEVLPRIKIINKTPSVKLRQETPRQSPARLGPYSTEFRSVRDYTINDPYKFINWKATARDPNYKLKVNDYEREGSRIILFALDNGWWMRYGTYEENPLELGIMLILSIARAFLKYGLNVGLWIPQSNIHITPTSGSTQYYRLLSILMRLEAITPRLNWDTNEYFDVNESSSKAKQNRYVYDPRVIYVISKERPIIIYVTNITKESIGIINYSLKAAVPLRTVLIDIIPNTTILSRYIEDRNIKCIGSSLMFQRKRLYQLLPRDTKIIPWDPSCETMGLITTKILNNIKAIL